ncbi:hypothetical protein [Terrisporobacter sp.]|uniref:hypothetical protein n=1 Tax=Terrisporobacter sp. TaxID=1965305 RepID=UPI002618D838|nr:hypothetical protein [Terrisporobacter sp.]
MNNGMKKYITLNHIKALILNNMIEVSIVFHKNKFLTPYIKTGIIVLLKVI